MKISKLNSSKLFYNKWPYKIECYISGASRLRWSGVEITKDFCQGKPSPSLWNWQSNDRLSKDDKAALLVFTIGVEPFLDLKDQLQVRVEGRRYNIYCKDPVLLEQIYNAVKPWVEKVFGPTTDEELNYMLDKGHKKILRDVLPKDGYKYKVYLKESWPMEGRIAFAEWAAKFPDTINISKNSKRWLESKHRWLYNPFMYVKDEKTLTMIGLFTSGNIKRVEEFILRSSINTCLDQEQTCQH
jgi:hypothetical protein